MFVDVEFSIELPQTIVVPAGAVVDSGNRQTVYVAWGEGVFEPRAVATGWRFGDRVQILRGLNGGERIVVGGNFLIDSESRMRLAAAGLMAEKAAATPPALEEPKAISPPEALRPAQVKERPKARPVAAKKAESHQAAVDPVCGMSVEKELAAFSGLTAEHSGKTYYFCTEDCRDQFKREPQRFLGTGSASPAGVQPAMAPHRPAEHRHD
jgi:YHS domain-containing protein